MWVNKTFGGFANPQVALLVKLGTWVILANNLLSHGLVIRWTKDPRKSRARKIAGSKIALSWSPMRVKILHCQPEFHYWLPAGDKLFQATIIIQTTLIFSQIDSNKIQNCPPIGHLLWSLMFYLSTAFEVQNRFSSHYKSTTTFHSYDQCEASWPCFFRCFPYFKTYGLWMVQGTGTRNAVLNKKQRTKWQFFS